MKVKVETSYNQVLSVSSENLSEVIKHPFFCKPGKTTRVDSFLRFLRICEVSKFKHFRHWTYLSSDHLTCLTTLGRFTSNIEETLFVYKGNSFATVSAIFVNAFSNL